MNLNWQIFLTLSLIMSLIIVLLLIINALFARKIAAKIRYFMWIVVMIGLLIPIRPTFGDGIINVANLAPPTTAPAVDFISETAATAIINPIPSAVVPQNDVGENEQITWQTLALLSWSTVAIAIIGYHLFWYIRFQGAINRWGEPEEDAKTLKIFEQVKQELRCGDKVKLVVCGFVSTSMLTGFLRPVILLPEKNYDDSELELIFRHELIHYQRKDLWIKLLSVITLALHWFNPFVYLMNIALQTEGEAACDQKVLAMSKLTSPHLYAEVIISMIGGKRTGMTRLATNFYGGKKGIKKRLAEIMTTTAPQKLTSYTFFALVLSLTIMSGSVFARQTPTPNPTAPNLATIAPENNDAILALAINAIGGGIIHEAYQLSDELLLAYVFHDNELYGVEIDLINYRITGLGISHQAKATNDEAVENNLNEIPPTTNTNPQQTATITSEQAIEIALAIAPGRLIEVSRDWEAGRPVWELEIRHEGLVHEFYIDMETGAILEHEFEIDD